MKRLRGYSTCHQDSQLGQRATRVWILRYWSPLLFFQTYFLIDQKLINYLSLLVSKPTLDPPISVFLVLRLHWYVTKAKFGFFLSFLISFFFVGSGNWIYIFMLASQVIYRLTYFLSPVYNIFTYTVGIANVSMGQVEELSLTTPQL